MVVIDVVEAEADNYKVRLAIWPLGNRMEARTLGTGVIANDGTGSHLVGNYTYRFFGKSGSKLKRGEGRITGYNRLRHHPWRLVKAVLDDMYEEPEENKL